MRGLSRRMRCKAWYSDWPQALIVADMLTPAGVPLLWPCRWRFRLPILAPRKGNRHGAIFMYGVVCTGGVDTAVHAGKQRHTLVFADDHYPANAVPSFYKSPD